MDQPGMQPTTSRTTALRPLYSATGSWQVRENGKVDVAQDDKGIARHCIIGLQPRMTPYLTITA